MIIDITFDFVEFGVVVITSIVVVIAVSVYDSVNIYGMLTRIGYIFHSGAFCVFSTRLEQKLSLTLLNTKAKYRVEHRPGEGWV